MIHSFFPSPFQVNKSKLLTKEFSFGVKSDGWPCDGEDWVLPRSPHKELVWGLHMSSWPWWEQRQGGNRSLAVHSKFLASEKSCLHNRQTRAHPDRYVYVHALNFKWQVTWTPTSPLSVLEKKMAVFCGFSLQMKHFDPGCVSIAMVNIRTKSK